MKTLLLILFMAFTVSAQQPEPVNCKVTRINKGVVTLRCLETDRRPTTVDVPRDKWPELWAGQCAKGASFPAQWVSGHLVPIADAKRLIQEMTREGEDYQRNPVNH